MSAYASKPSRLLMPLTYQANTVPASGIYCAGFELTVWRCDALADHLIEWMADYALHEEELSVNHGNMYVRLKEAAVRVYSSPNYKKRGEVGEIAMHAICRDFFETIPLAPRVLYLTSSNDVVKSFDLVHVRYIAAAPELWLGEAKFFDDGIEAARAAVQSLNDHLEAGFLRNEKLILGPQISKNIPMYQEIRDLLSERKSLDELFRTAVFPICLVSTSAAAAGATHTCEFYLDALKIEVEKMSRIIAESGLPQRVRLLLLHLPLASKQKLAAAFDLRLKGLAP